MEVEPLALKTRGSKASPAPVDDYLALAAGKKAAEPEALAAGKKNASAAEEAKSSAGAANKKTKLVKVRDDYINLLLAESPDPTFSQRLRSLNQESGAFAAFDPEERQEILDLLPEYADIVDKQNETRLDILRQYHQTGCAYEEIEVDE